jgi:hypothetical protein
MGFGLQKTPVADLSPRRPSSLSPGRDETAAPLFHGETGTGGNDAKNRLASDLRPASAPPALAQSSDTLNQTLGNTGRSLSGQDRDRDQTRGGKQGPAYQRVYRDTREDARNYSDRDLQDAQERVEGSWTQLQAVSDALTEEAQRRGRGSGSGMLPRR